MRFDYKQHNRYEAAVNKTRCRAAVSRARMGVRQCANTPVKGDRYCRIHTDAGMLTREQRVRQRWEDRAKMRKRMEEQNAVALLREQGYTVTPPRKKAR